MMRPASFLRLFSAGFVIRLWAVLVLLLLGGMGVSWGQAIHSNTCGSATAGWTYTNGTPTQAIQQGSYWLLEDADVIISEAFDVSSYNGGLTLSFKVGTYGSGSPNKPCLAEYSTDNGVTWSTTTFTSATPTSSTLIASGTFSIAASSATQFKLRFTKASSGGRQGVRLDDILLQGTITSTPTITLADNGTQVVAANVAEGVLFPLRVAIRK